MSYLNELLRNKAFAQVLKIDNAFDITNVADYIYALPKDLYDVYEDCLCIVPPFRRTWFEFKIPEKMKKDYAIKKTKR